MAPETVVFKLRVALAPLQAPLAVSESALLNSVVQSAGAGVTVGVNVGEQAQGVGVRVGVDAPGPRARDMLDLGRPDIGFVPLAQGLGLHAARADTTERFNEELARALATPGPSVVEAVVPGLL